MFEEWEAWRKLCVSLRATGAVTQADLESSTSEADTVGKLLLADIRRWGLLFALLPGSERKARER